MFEPDTMNDTEWVVLRRHYNCQKIPPFYHAASDYESDSDMSDHSEYAASEAPTIPVEIEDREQDFVE